MKKEKLNLDKYFTLNPEYLQEWTKRDVEIKDSVGRMIYSGKDIEAPVNWSNMAVQIVASKYMYAGNEKNKPLEKSVKQLIHRVVDTLANEGYSQGIFSKEGSKNFYDKLFDLVFKQATSFNSPVWFNVGLNKHYGVRENRGPLEKASHWAVDKSGKISNEVDAYERPQGSACFIQSIEDNMESILTHAKKEGMLFKYGSGTGTNFSTLRGSNEPLSGGGVASGKISFLRIYDALAGRIQSGGKTRRAAKMVITDDNHPDFLRFILWKVNEEKKALWLSANPEWGPRNPMDLESEAYKTVDGQNGNNSVRLSNGFMEAALKSEEWDLWFKTKDKLKAEKEISLKDYKDDRYLPDKRFIKKITNKRKTINAGDALELIARAAYVTGDPGVQYDTTINEWHTCPNSGRINASNPCSEFMFIDDSACNLASLNLEKFSSKERLLDLESFENAVKTTIIGQEILVGYSSYPSKEIAENSNKFRPLGLGFTNLGAVLMSKGIPYDSDEGRAIASAVTSLMTATAYETSAELASHLGAFEEFEKNKEPMLNVIKKHQEHTKKIKKMDISGLEEVLNEADKIWKRVVEKGEKYGFRNSQVTLLAPTGTIGFMMDVDCTGIEPMIGLKTSKGLAGGGQLERSAAPSVIYGLESLGYKGQKLENILKFIEENGTVLDAPELDKKDYNIFATSLGENSISVDGHLKMMAVVQPFLSGAISKTVNLPKGSTIEDIKEVYVKGWNLGLKSITPYVDGSKGIQPVNIVQKSGAKNGPKWGERIKPKSPTERIGYNVDINGTGVHFIIGEYSNRPPKEAPADFFVEFGSSGSPFSAVYTSWSKEASRGRQRGGTLEEFIKHNLGASGPIRGMTDHQFIKTCSSIEDFLAKLIRLEYLGDFTSCDVEPTPEEIEKLRCNILARRRRNEHFSSRIGFIDSIINKGKITEIFPLFEDEIKNGEISIGETFCLKCGSATILSGANCRKCPNCGDASGCG